MYKIALFILTGVVIGLLANHFVPAVLNSENSQSSTQIVSLTKRLEVLEAKIMQEQETISELQFLLADIEMSRGSEQGPRLGVPVRPEALSLSVNPDSQVANPQAGMDINPERIANIRRQFQRRNDPAVRISRLEQTGFSSDQASWLVEAEQEARSKETMEVLYRDWERRRQEAENNQESWSDSLKEQILFEMGDEGYEKYLEANGSSTSVRIGNVIEYSPAALAGLKLDDEIISYNGERIYGLQDLNSAAVKGELGEPVVLTVVRDGVETQIPMERGPLGISSQPEGRRFFGQDAIRTRRTR